MSAIDEKLAAAEVMLRTVLDDAGLSLEQRSDRPGFLLYKSQNVRFNSGMTERSALAWAIMRMADHIDQKARTSGTGSPAYDTLANAVNAIWARHCNAGQAPMDIDPEAVLRRANAVGEQLDCASANFSATNKAYVELDERFRKQQAESAVVAAALGRLLGAVRDTVPPVVAMSLLLAARLSDGDAATINNAAQAAGREDGMAATKEIYNAALSYALDGGADAEGLTFLRLWREGDWETIDREFPTFRNGA